MGSKFVPDEFRINSGYMSFYNHITTVFLAQRGGCFDKSVGYIWLLLDVPVDVAGDAAAGHGAVPELEVLPLRAVVVRRALVALAHADHPLGPVHASQALEGRGVKRTYENAVLRFVVSASGVLK